MSANSLSKQVTIKKHGRRYWAVYVDSELLAITVYKRGAFAVKNLIQNLITYAAGSKPTRFSDAPDERPNRD